MGKKCTPCGNVGHKYSSTCTTDHIHKGSLVNGLRLFGVQLIDISSFSSSSSSSSSSLSSTNSVSMKMKTSLSMDGLVAASSTPSFSSSFASNYSQLVSKNDKSSKIPNGSLSDGRTMEKKKGVPWSKKEHLIFLVGLEKLGKGHWKGISSNFVTTRTPIQVASHAQKYFLRKNFPSKTKRTRDSLFDLVTRKEKLAQSHETSTSLGFWQKKQACRATHQASIPVWLHGSCESQSIANSNLTKSFVHNAAEPDLELTLATPRPMNLSQSCTFGLSY